jgi:hypothetical protein
MTALRARKMEERNVNLPAGVGLSLPSEAVFPLHFICY